MFKIIYTQNGCTKRKLVLLVITLSFIFLGCEDSFERGRKESNQKSEIQKEELEQDGLDLSLVKIGHPLSGVTLINGKVRVWILKTRRVERDTLTVG